MPSVLGCLCVGICQAAFILLLERISFILGLSCLSDRFICKIFSLFKDIVDRLKKEFLDQIYLYKQVDDLNDVNDRLKSKTYKHDILVELDSNQVTKVTLESDVGGDDLVIE